jgi:hydrogenase maturation protein HypF
MPDVRTLIEATGTVQGIGFRPAVARLAAASSLTGWIRNLSGSVRISLEGDASTVDRVIRALPSNVPSGARIDSLRIIESRPLASSERAPSFSIEESDAASPTEIVIPPDLAICHDCLREICDPRNRRYGHPFTTCTACGPRYTIVNSTPYDRARTTMAAFPMCHRCRQEYDNPSDRRFHAETIACPECGPNLWIEDANGRRIDATPFAHARKAVAAGAIVAVRGIGGFLLAADACNRDAIRVLRERKRRPHKPLAVMARNADVIRRVCRMSPEAESLLNAPEAPIVILEPDDAADPSLLAVDLLGPDVRTVGVMLPTSPLHELLLNPLPGDPVPAFDWMVMTSGNARSEPICISNDEARTRLRGIADLFLMHNREINLRNDDSVCVFQSSGPQVWRRARGYAPHPVRLPVPAGKNILAAGAELKNTICLGYGTQAVLSPHIGDLETPEAVDAHARALDEIPRFLKRVPELVAVDLHPDMNATLAGRRVAAHHGVPVIAVQHHVAHAAACLAEHGLSSGLVLAFDGTGLGPDGAVWGAELIHIAPPEWERLATFAPVPLPGGDAAVREPARQLAARWIAADAIISSSHRRRLGLSDGAVAAIEQQCRRGFNAPMTHAAGRVFDSFASALGLAPASVTYEGQAAVRLEAAARSAGETPPEVFPFEAREDHGMLLIDWSETFRRLADALPPQDAVPRMALAAHHAIARAAEAMVLYGLERAPARAVGISGGVFMNRLLTKMLTESLRARGIDVLVHSAVPPNDGCIALGQVVIAAAGMNCEGV